MTSPLDSNIYSSLDSTTPALMTPAFITPALTTPVFTTPAFTNSYAAALAGPAWSNFHEERKQEESDWSSSTSSTDSRFWSEGSNCDGDEDSIFIGDIIEDFKTDWGEDADSVHRAARGADLYESYNFRGVKRKQDALEIEGALNTDQYGGLTFRSSAADPSPSYNPCGRNGESSSQADLSLLEAWARCPKFVDDNSECIFPWPTNDSPRKPRNYTDDELLAAMALYEAQYKRPKFA